MLRARAWLAGLILAVATGLVAQDFPKIKADNLNGQPVALPDAVSGRVAVLVLGFSKASKTPTSAWDKRIETGFAHTPDLAVYQLPVLEDVPGFIRGMVISSMKKGVPEAQRDRFIPVLHGESDLKKLVTYKEPDDAYLILLDRSGQIAYQMHGALSETGYTEFRRHIAALLH